METRALIAVLVAMATLVATSASFARPIKPGTIPLGDTTATPHGGSAGGLPPATYKGVSER